MKSQSSGFSHTEQTANKADNIAELWKSDPAAYELLGNAMQY